MAFEELMAALEKDPLATPIRRSFDVVAGRIRAALAEPARKADDPSTPRLYALLQRTGDADVPSHVAMVRYLLAAGAPVEARALAEAMVRLHPGSQLAWETLVEVAVATGDAAGAERARIEAACVAVEPTAFAVPGRATA
jgi:alkylated DNA nucleotide flippase Atl1